jgi:hypothetical protein
MKPSKNSHRIEILIKLPNKGPQSMISQKVHQQIKQIKV